MSCVSFSQDSNTAQGFTQSTGTSTAPPTGSSLTGILTSLAAEHKSAPDMLGENGDPCHSSLGFYSDDLEQLASKTLALKQELVGNDESRITSVVEGHWRNVTQMLSSLSEQDRKAHIVLLFKLTFFSRAIRCQGNRSRVQFFELFKKIRTEFPEESLSVLSLIPHYGCFQDIDKMITYYQKVGDSELVNGLVNVYSDALANDFQKIFGVDVRSTPFQTLMSMVVPLNKGFVNKTPEEVKAYCREKGINNLTQACKWMKREGKSGSAHRDMIIDSLFKGYPSLNQGRKLMRHCTTFGSKLLVVVEQFMTSGNWAMIDPKFVPSVATTKHRLAFLNKTKSGETRSTDEGRVSCADTFLTAILEGKINGAQSDLKKLADLIWEKGNFGGSYCYSYKQKSTLTEVERKLINAQWKEMVGFVRKLVEEKHAKDLAERQARIDAGEAYVPPVQDPRAVMPVVDTSGSMSSAGVMHYAIAMGIVCASISTIPGKLITFSEAPEVFSFNPDEDIFTLVRKIMGCKWGMNTNLDATYQLLLGEMKVAKASGSDISTDFRLAIFTDGQFDSMVSYGSTGTSYGYGRRAMLSGFDTFQKRQEKAFTQAGFGVPLVVYWNMANRSVGFPAQSDTTGVLLVAGFSQTVMVEVMSGDYSLVIDEDTGAVKVNVTPLESFLKTMNDESFNPVVMALDTCWSKSHDTPPPAPSAIDLEIADLEAKLLVAKQAKANASV